MGEVTVIVPNDCPVIVCVLVATAVMVTPEQGSGAGGGEVSVFLHAAKNAVNKKHKMILIFFIRNCSSNT